MSGGRGSRELLFICYQATTDTTLTQTFSQNNLQYWLSVVGCDEKYFFAVRQVRHSSNIWCSDKAEAQIEDTRFRLSGYGDISIHHWLVTSIWECKLKEPWQQHQGSLQEPPPETQLLWAQEGHWAGLEGKPQDFSGQWKKISKRENYWEKVISMEDTFVFPVRKVHVKPSLRRNISGTVEFIRVTVNNRCLSSRKIEKDTEAVPNYTLNFRC